FEEHTAGTRGCCGIAKEGLYRSTKNGLYYALVREGHLIISCAFAIIFFVFGILSLPCCDFSRSKKFFVSMVKSACGSLGFLKDFIYHIIRAVPIVGYPISQGINWLAEKFYGLDCVFNYFGADYMRNMGGAALRIRVRG